VRWRRWPLSDTRSSGHSGRENERDRTRWLLSFGPAHRFTHRTIAEMRNGRLPNAYGRSVGRSPWRNTPTGNGNDMNDCIQTHDHQSLCALSRLRAPHPTPPGLYSDSSLGYSVNGEASSNCYNRTLWCYGRDERTRAIKNESFRLLRTIVFILIFAAFIARCTLILRVCALLHFQCI